MVRRAIAPPFLPGRPRPRPGRANCSEVSRTMSPNSRSSDPTCATDSAAPASNLRISSSTAARLRRFALRGTSTTSRSAARFRRNCREKPVDKAWPRSLSGGRTRCSRILLNWDCSNARNQLGTHSKALRYGNSGPRCRQVAAAARAAKRPIVCNSSDDKFANSTGEA